MSILSATPCAPFSSLASFYDSIHGRRNYARSANLVSTFFSRHAAASGGSRRKVVEWGCGTGEYLKQFRAAGWQAVGFDTSPEMVEAARAKGLPASHGNICGHWGEVESWPAFGQACLFGSFSYACHTDRQVMSALENVRRWGAGGGVFVFDVVNYACCAANLYENSKSKFAHNGETLDWCQRKSFDAASSLLTIQANVDNPETAETLAEERHTLRAFTPSEIRTFLHAAGLPLIAMLDPEGGEYRPAITAESYYFMAVASIPKR